MIRGSLSWVSVTGIVQRPFSWTGQHLSTDTALSTWTNGPVLQKTSGNPTFRQISAEFSTFFIHFDDIFIKIASNKIHQIDRLVTKKFTNNNTNIQLPPVPLLTPDNQLCGIHFVNTRWKGCVTPGLWSAETYHVPCLLTRWHHPILHSIRIEKTALVFFVCLIDGCRAGALVDPSWHIVPGIYACVVVCVLCVCVFFA